MNLKLIIHLWRQVREQNKIIHDLQNDMFFLKSELLWKATKKKGKAK